MKKMMLVITKIRGLKGRWNYKWLNQTMLSEMVYIGFFHAASGRITWRDSPWC